MCLLIAIIAALSMAPQLGRSVTSLTWDADSLYYRSQALELRGVPVQQARRELFTGPLSTFVRTHDADEPGEPRRFTDPHWVDYNARFYRRRWTLPAAAAALEPVFGARSLQILSLLGYVAIGPLLFLLLRRRFTGVVAAVVSLVLLALPATRSWSVIPLTDSWGVALLLCGLLGARRVLDRGPRALPWWIAAVLALSFTRDTTLILVLAAATMAVLLRSRRGALLAATGFLASLPAPAIFGGSVRETLAFVVNDLTVPPQSTWSFIADHYPATFSHMLSRYAHSMSGNALTVAALLAGIAGVALLTSRRDRREPWLAMVMAMPLGYLALLVLGPTYSAYRYELVLLPVVAVGLALIGERLLGMLERRVAAGSRAETL